MEELQVGEFIRTKSGELYKIDYVGESVVTAGEEVIIPLNYIENHSTDIIELVKEGDYVNGIEVVTVYGYDEDGNDREDKGIIEVDDDYAYGVYLEDINIKTIVTSEKIASVEFKVEA